MTRQPGNALDTLPRIPWRPETWWWESMAPVAPLDGSGVEVLIANHPPGTQLSLDVRRGVQRKSFTLVTAAPP